MYTTTKTTLERAPFIDALLRNMGSMADATIEGNVFIDRDGEAFKDILAFLRSGCPVVSHVPLSILQREADFYGITGFQAVSGTKQVFLPESTKQHDTIKGVFHDLTRRGQKRYRFISALPADVPTQIGSKGMTGCVTEDVLAEFGFRLTPEPCTSAASPSADAKVKAASDDETDDEEPVVFKRTKLTHYVDLQTFSVPDDGSTWDKVEKRECDGREFAVVTKYC